MGNRTEEQEVCIVALGIIGGGAKDKFSSVGSQISGT